MKEYYFTGGEPFLHSDIVSILKQTLTFGPATVLTNGTVLKDEWLADLSAAETHSPYSLEFRVSIDGFSPNRTTRSASRHISASHAGVTMLVQHGFMPIITAARTWTDDREDEVVGAFVKC